MGTVLKCSECRGAIKFTGRFPDSCPFCGVEMHNGDDEVLAVPAFLTKAKHVDRVYRDMEKGSEIRAQVAAEMLGVPVSDMADIKITDLKDARHAGEIAAKPVVNDVTRQMDTIAAAGGQVGFQGNGAQYAGAVQTGFDPNSGIKQLTILQNHHGKIADRPALETLQPGYIRRG